MTMMELQYEVEKHGMGTSERAHVEVRMLMTLNDTCFSENDGKYDVVGQGVDVNTQFRVRQLWGQKPEYENDKNSMRKAYVVEENPVRNFGIFTVERYDYTPSCSKPTMVGIRITNIGAHELAHRIASKYARQITVKDDLSDVVDRIEDDKRSLRARLEEIKELAKR